MTSKRIAQTNQQQKSKASQASGILQRAAVHSVSDTGMQLTDVNEALALSNSAFSKDFSQVLISTTKPQQIMVKLRTNPVENKNDVVQRYQKTNQGKLSKNAELLVTNDQELYASDTQRKQANKIPGQVEFQPRGEKEVKSSEQDITKTLTQVQPKVKKDTILYKQIYGQGENKGWDAAQDIKNLVVSLETQVFNHVNRKDDGEKLEQAENEIPMENNSPKSKEQLKKQRSQKILARVLELAENPEDQARQALKGYLVKNMDNLSRELLPSDCRALANFILAGEGVERVAQENKPGVGLKIQPKEGGNGEWPFHYAAIVMTDGEDYVTLENAAAKESEMYSKLEYDRTWYFEMYGEDTEQTFENKYQADFNQSGEVKKFTTSNQPQKSETPQASGILQKKEISGTSSESMNTSRVVQENKTGLPDNLKAGIENLSGMSMDDVKVHYNSSKPAQIQALAYTQGKDIYVGSGQERHLAHEAWHVVQQKQGRVKPTRQAKGVAINDDRRLEKEADVMGAKALSVRRPAPAATRVAAQAARAEQRAGETAEALDVQGETIGTSGEKERLNFLSTQSKGPQPQHLVKLPEPDFAHSVKTWTEPVQLLQVRETIDSYLAENLASKENIRAYFYEYEIPLMVQRVNEYSRDDDLIKEVNGRYQNYQRWFSRNAQSTVGNWTQVSTRLRQLVQSINMALQTVGTGNPPTGYEANDTNNWKDFKEAVTSAHGLVNKDNLSTRMGRNLAPLRTIPYSKVKENFPPTLFRLIRDIFGSWRDRQVMDERTPNERENHILNSNSPGALRSWHMNTSGTLPPIAAPLTPANATALEEHYQNTSGVMNMLEVPARPAGPIGFAEYTGTGILNDAHNSKIVLDYRGGHVYLTLSHYQFWTNDNNNFQTQGQVNGRNNPWFKIDMNS